MDLQIKEPLKEPLVQTSVRVTTLNRSAKGIYIMGMVLLHRKQKQNNLKV